MGVRWLVVASVALAACGGQASAATLHGNVKYSKSGGIAGVIQHLTVRPDGSGVASSYERKRAFTLPQTRLRALERAVKLADLAHTSSPKAGHGADAFAYGVEYGGHRVDWSDLSDDPPTRVLRLYDLLDSIYEKYRPRSS